MIHNTEGVEEGPKEGGDSLGNTKEVWKVDCRSTLTFSALYFVDKFVAVK